MKVFLDTNVLVAAFAARGLCAELFRLVAAEHELLLGEPVLIEIRRILETKLRMPPGTRNEVMRVLRRFPRAAAAKAPIALGIRDPDDEWIVACALAASADVFVTGDKGILAARGRVKAMPIVSPREFWMQLRPVE